MSYNSMVEDRKRKEKKLRQSHGEIMRKGGAHRRSYKAERHFERQSLREVVKNGFQEEIEGEDYD